MKEFMKRDVNISIYIRKTWRCVCVQILRSNLLVRDNLLLGFIVTQPYIDYLYLVPSVSVTETNAYYALWSIPIVSIIAFIWNLSAWLHKWKKFINYVKGEKCRVFWILVVLWCFCVLDYVISIVNSVKYIYVLHPVICVEKQ